MTLDDETILKLQERFGIDLSKNEWIEQALTMRSYVNEHPGIEGHNQPLATLGDAVIRLLVMNNLFLKGERGKGVMTIKAEDYVKGTALTEIARRISLEKTVNWGKGDAGLEIWKGDRILGECLEAIFGAIFIGEGFETCREVYLTIAPSSDETFERLPDCIN